MTNTNLYLEIDNNFQNLLPDIIDILNPAIVYVKIQKYIKIGYTFFNLHSVVLLLCLVKSYS